MVNKAENPTQPNPMYLIYMYKEDLASNNLQWLICHKTNLTKPIMYNFLSCSILKSM